MPKLIFKTRPHQYQGRDFLAGSGQLLPHHRQFALKQKTMLLQQLSREKKAKQSSTVSCGWLIALAADRSTNVLIASLAAYTV